MFRPRTETYPTELIENTIEKFNVIVERVLTSYEHFLQVIWLQPPFFSIVASHLMHSFVCAEIQLAVSESSAHFFNQSFTKGQIQGWWSGREQPKQKTCPQAQVTVGTVSVSLDVATLHSTAYSQPGAGHQRRYGWSSTYVRMRRFRYLYSTKRVERKMSERETDVEILSKAYRVRTFGLTTISTVPSSMTREQFPGHDILRASPSPIIF